MGRTSSSGPSGESSWPPADMNEQRDESPLHELLRLSPLTPYSNEGDGHIMGMEVGAAVALMDHSIYQPTIRVEGEEIDGRPFNRPVSYGYPGNIIVNRYAGAAAMSPSIRILGGPSLPTRKSPLN